MARFFSRDRAFSRPLYPRISAAIALLRRTVLVLVTGWVAVVLVAGVLGGHVRQRGIPGYQQFNPALASVHTGPAAGRKDPGGTSKPAGASTATTTQVATDPVPISTGAPVLPGQGPAGSTGPVATSGSSGGGFSISGMISDAIGSFFSTLVDAALNPALSLLSKTVLSTPDPSSSGQVRTIWESTAGITDSLYVLLVIAAAFVAMTAGTVNARYEVKQAAPRVVVAFIAANASLGVISLAISFANGISRALMGGNLSGTDAVNAMANSLTDIVATGGLFVVLIGLVVAFLAILVAATFVLRSAVVVLLAVLAPLLLATHALPATEGIARIWWRALAAALGIQIAQAILLTVTLDVFFAPGGNDFFGFTGTGGLVNLITVGCLLWLLVKIPSIAMRAIFSGRRSSGLASAAKSYVTYKVIRSVVAKAATVAAAA